MTVVAILGTGIMGAGMARNMIRSGLEVRVWNRTAARADPLAGDGAMVAGSAADAVRGADVIVTMLNDGSGVDQAIAAAIPGISPGQVWAQMTTVGIDGTEHLAEIARAHDLVFVDAPVQGSRQPAEAGQLTVLASGPDEARDRVQPVFDAVGARTLWLGPAGMASRLKLASNSWVLTLTNGVAEALALTQGLGLDPQQFLDLVRGGPLDSPYLQMKAAAMLAGDFSPNFSTGNAAKDAGLVVDAAHRAGLLLDMAEAGAARFRRAVEAGHGDDDMASTYLVSFPNNRPEAPPEAAH